uniref:Secreted protein n=1 Tax=Vespula pensylvanica TaxID=30213 RepID=A0A834JPK3_VESPE|nr:hypothetical protein H0235_017731 [Vespula pensylvanica]
MVLRKYWTTLEGVILTTSVAAAAAAAAAAPAEEELHLLTTTAEILDNISHANAPSSSSPLDVSGDQLTLPNRTSQKAISIYPPM